MQAGSKHLRVALLTMTEAAGAGSAMPRAFLRVGGANLARHQATILLAAGCGMVVCLSRDFGPELIALQHEVERAGAKFHVVSGPRGLSGLVTSADELLVMAEGLLPMPADALQLLDGPPAVLAQPAETGVPAGFERIDLNHAWAGAMLLPGRLVDRLMELPEDAALASALLRIALQAGIGLRSVPDDLRLNGRWLMIRSEDEAHQAEQSWLARHTARGKATPGPMLARLIVRQFGPAVLYEASGARVLALVAVILALVGFAAAWFELMPVALILAGVGWVLGRAAEMLARVQRATLSLQPGSPLRFSLLGWLFDALLVAILALGLPSLPGEPTARRVFAPLVLIGLLRLLPRAFPSNWAGWAEDRAVVVSGLLLLVLGGALEPGVMAVAALLLVAGLVLPADRPNPDVPKPDDDRLTRV